MSFITWKLKRVFRPVKNKIDTIFHADFIKFMSTLQIVCLAVIAIPIIMLIVCGGNKDAVYTIMCAGVAVDFAITLVSGGLILIIENCFR